MAGSYYLRRSLTDKLRGNIIQTENITAIRSHQVYLKYLIFIVFMSLMHISVVLPDQLKHMSWFQLCLLSRDAAKNLRISSFTERGSQNWNAVVMFRVFNQNWAWWVTNTNEGYYFFLSLQTNFHFLFSSVAAEACIPALPHSERKRPGRAGGGISCEKSL